VLPTPATASYSLDPCPALPMQTTRPTTGLDGPSRVPGPADRVSFLDEQEARRRQTWRHTALCALAAALGGMPLGMFLTPLAYLVLVLGLRVAPVPVPETVWASLRGLAGVIPAFFDAIDGIPDLGLLDTLRYVGRAAGTLAHPFGSPWLTLAALVGPGMLITVLVWLGYRALFRRAGVGGMLLRLGARPPRVDDPEERRLVNLVEEMAIAGGLPAPGVRLLDSPIPNAVAIGSTPETAVVIVTRGLLERLDRDEAQGVVGHLVGSVGNGDLRIALSITTVFQALELIFTGFDALLNLSRSAWRDLFLVARGALLGGRDPRAAEAVSHLLDHRIGEIREDGVQGMLADAHSDRPRTAPGRLLRRLPMLQIVFFPFLILYFLTLLLRMQVWLVRFALVGPLLMRVWRTRRFLADATAVQLTRNPDGLARGLERLAAEGGVVPGGQWFSHLFVVGPEAASLRNGGFPPDDEEGGKAFTEELGGAASHPGIPQRLHRLRAQGALLRRADPAVAARPPVQVRAPRWARALSGALGMALVVPLLALAAVLAAFAFTAIFMFGVMAAVFFSAAAMALLVPLMG
jgi:Zn-dependent protease with chaperone function